MWLCWDLAWPRQHMCIKRSHQQEERNPKVPSSTKRRSPWLKWHSKSEIHFPEGPPQNNRPVLPSFHARHECWSLHSLRENILQLQAKKSFCPGLLETLYKFACPYKLPPLPTPSCLIHCSSVPESSPITTSYSAISHGSTLMMWLTAGSSSSFPSMDFLLQHPVFTNL